MRIASVLCALVALEACATHQGPVDFTQPAYIVFQEPSQPNELVSVMLTRYDPATGIADERQFFTHSRLDDRGARWHVFNVAEGEYVLRWASVMRDRNIWRVCFDAGTYAFAVSDGEILYGGQIDLRPALSELVAQLDSQWRPATAGVMMRVSDSASPPSVSRSAPTDYELAQARAVMDSSPRHSVRWAPPREISAVAGGC